MTKEAEAMLQAIEEMADHDQVAIMLSLGRKLTARLGVSTDREIFAAFETRWKRPYAK
jgi:hypothetical protein